MYTGATTVLTRSGLHRPRLVDDFVIKYILSLGLVYIGMLYCTCIQTSSDGYILFTSLP